MQTYFQSMTKVYKEWFYSILICFKHCSAVGSRHYWDRPRQPHRICVYNVDNRLRLRKMEQKQTTNGLCHICLHH